jgi:Concanavalin A-like lectin/glucanases superfamily
MSNLFDLTKKLFAVGLFVLWMIVAIQAPSANIWDSGYCLYMDGINDYVVNYSSGSSADIVTFESWVKLETYGGVPFQTVFEVSLVAPISTPEGLPYTEPMFFYYISGDGKIGIESYNTASVFPDARGYLGNVGRIESDISIPLNSWVHLAVVVDRLPGGINTAIYIDGTLAQNYYPGPFANYTNPYDPNDLGNGWSIGGGGIDFLGYIDEVRVWDVARSQADIVAFMNTPLTGNEAGLVSYYDFNEGSGGGTEDKASSYPQRDGLILGASWVPIPEPSAMLFGITCLCCILRIRNKH